MARKLVVEVVGDTKSLDRNLNKASRTVKGFSGDVGKSGRGALAASGAFHSLGRSIAFASGAFLGAAGLTTVMKQSIEVAIDLEKEMAKTEAVFGKNTKSVEKWSKTMASSFGIAEDVALKSANQFGQLFKVMGVGSKASLNMSKNLTELSAKLALFTGKTQEEAAAALAGGLTGRTRALKAYGIVIDQVAIKAEAMRLGLLKSNVSARAVEEAQTRVAIATAKAAEAHSKYAAGTTQVAAADLAVQKSQDALKKVTDGVTGSVTNAQKATAIYSLVQRQSGAATATWTKEQGSAEVQMKRLHAELRDSEATIGNALLPTVTKLTKSMADWLGKTENQKKIQHDVNTVVATAATVLGAVRDIVHTMTPFVKALNSALGGTKHTFELLLTLGIVAKLRAISIALGLTGTTGVAGGAAAATVQVKRLSGSLAVLTSAASLKGLGRIAVLFGGIATAAAGAYIAAEKLGGYVNKLLGITGGGATPNDLFGAIGGALGIGGGKAKKPTMATDNIKKGYVTVFGGRTYRWNGKGWTDISLKSKGSSASGKSGPITAGLAAVEHFAGGKINDDFATSGHAPNSYHYKGQAADLAVDRGVWNRLFANRHMFAELFGPWGLYHYGTQFYDRKLQADHMNHIHVAYTGGPQAISKMLAGGSGGSAGPSVAGVSSGGGGGPALHVGGSPTAPAWKGATQATIIAAKASVTSMIGAAKQVIGGMAGPMDEIERAAIAHLQKLKEHLHPHMTAADLARTKADIAKWGKVLNNEIAAQTKAAKRAFDQASKDLFRAFDKATELGLKALAAPDKTPTEQILADRQQARDDAQRQQALADAIAAGDAQAVADAQYDIETARLEKIAEAERKAADEKAQADQDAYQQQRDDQKQALQDQLDDWETWLTNKKKSWNQFWKWIKDNPNGGNITPPNMSSTKDAPNFGSSKPLVSGGFVQVQPTNSGGFAQISGSPGVLGHPIPTLATGGMVSKTGLAVVHEGETFSGVNGGQDYVIHNVVQLDGKVLYESWKKQGARDSRRNGGTGVRS